MPCDYSKYPVNWPEIRQAILERAENKCELCGAENHQPHPITGSRVVLTIAHIDQNRENNKPWNLLALCQRCHLKIDLPFKMRGRIQRMEEQAKGKTENVLVSYNDELIKGIAKEIIEKIKDYLGRHDINDSGIDVHITTDIQPGQPYEIKVLTTIYQNNEVKLRMRRRV